ncbi:DNA repair protein SWI5 homolog isoform X4 [Rhincodon typus]|uniref:DNA repair protein SWI5 homolog isoform X4 n=1 Tax=Rhincodon typus TaxID=259920 RepID=UPI00202FD4CC|nr:DNA repair protein SWI5 homolog isoform X4 [Rhincodon typus]
MAIGCLRSRVRKLRVPMAAERERGDAGQCSPRSGFSAPEQLLCTRTPSNREGGGTAGRSFRRTPLGPSRKLNASFKSPVQISLDHELDSAGLQLHVENLRKKCNNLDREIAELLSAFYGSVPPDAPRTVHSPRELEGAACKPDCELFSYKLLGVNSVY